MESIFLGFLILCYASFGFAEDIGKAAGRKPSGELFPSNSGFIGYVGELTNYVKLRRSTVESFKFLILDGSGPGNGHWYQFCSELKQTNDEIAGLKELILKAAEHKWKILPEIETPPGFPEVCVRNIHIYIASMPPTK